MGELNTKQKAFCEEYIIDFNATQASIRAGYSSKTANAQASRLLANVKVQAYIATLVEARSKRVSIDADYVLRRHVEIDQMDIADIFKDDETLKPLREWPKVFRQYLNGFEVSELFDYADDEKKQIGVLKKMKWPDKIRNLELLGKHVDVQAYREKIDVEEKSTLVPFAAIIAKVDDE